MENFIILRYLATILLTAYTKTGKFCKFIRITIQACAKDLYKPTNWAKTCLICLPLCMGGQGTRDVICSTKMIIFLASQEVLILKILNFENFLILFVVGLFKQLSRKFAFSLNYWFVRPLNSNWIWQNLKKWRLMEFSFSENELNHKLFSDLT